MQQIGFANETTVLTDGQVRKAMAALQIQIDRDFDPEWNIGPIQLVFLPKGQGPGPGVWELVFADTSDQAGALGYHELTEWDAPIGFVFVKTDLDNESSWTVTASHELCEMLADPRINTIVEVDHPDGSYSFYAKEVSDAVEDDQFGYKIDLPDGSRVLVSDFVTQNWFDPLAVPILNRKYDFVGHCSKPFELLVNGYISILNVQSGPQWTQLNGQLKRKTEADITPLPMHRRHTRMLGQTNWKRSGPRKRSGVSVAEGY